MMTRPTRFVSLWILLTLLIAALMALALSFGSADASGSDAEAIAALLHQMESAIRAQDRETYLSYVDTSDPVFLLEHTRWADDWAELHPVERYDLLINDLQVQGDHAIGELTVIWSLKDNPKAQSATFAAQFRRDDAATWRYAGEYWVTTQAGDHFSVRAAPGLEEIAARVTALLPGIYRQATTALDYTPTARNEIKLYADAPSLIANTLLSLPTIAGWNEPGEALKLVASGERGDDRLRFVITHEFTHQLTFDMAGGSHGNFPWWLEEGIAQYTGMMDWARTAQDDYLRQVRSWEANGELVAWDQISDFEDTPLDLWRNVYPQGYALVRYVTETYGEDRRNEWLKAMAVELTLPKATQEVLGVDFDTLDRDFRAWLDEGQSSR